MILGPLSILKFKGLICPCLEKEEDGMVRPAASSLSYVPVNWYRPALSDQDNGVIGSAVNLMSSWIGKSSKDSEGTTTKSSRSDAVVNAIISFEDSVRGPCLVIRKKDCTDDNDAMEGDDQQRLTTQSWLLKKLEKATPVEAGYFMGGGITAASSGIVLHKRIKDGSQVECCKFDLCSAADSNFETLADNSERDDIVDKMNLVITWNRQRHSNQQDEVEDDDDSEDETSGTKNKITDRAKKAAHFAKREIEMKKQKREREQRKARYLKDTGGLKYTAVAMANRAGVS